MVRSRPHVVLNAAMTLDGKIATASGDSGISSAKDMRRVHKLRSRVDAILVGINTVIVDDPMLRAKGAGRKKNLLRVIVDSRGRIPLDSRIMRSSKRIRTVIATSQLASGARLAKIRSRGAVPVVLGRKRVDLPKLLRFLRASGVRKLLLEGGGEINWSMLSQHLVDEVIVTVAPRIVGGRNAVTLAEGPGTATIARGARLRLQRIVRNGDEAVLYYRVA